MNMDLELKYIEDKFLYEIDEYFFSALDSFTLDEASMMVGQVLAILTELPDKQGWSQEVAGVINADDGILGSIPSLIIYSNRKIS